METKASICDNCIHKKVCTFKGDVVRFTNNIVTDLKYVPSILEINFKCQEFERNGGVPRMEAAYDARKVL